VGAAGATPLDPSGGRISGATRPWTPMGGRSVPRGSLLCPWALTRS
jgi:hypothetical protein